MVAAVTTQSLVYVAFNPSSLGIYAPVAGQQGLSVPSSALEVLGKASAVCALNGPFFDTANGDTASYEASTVDTLLTRHFDEGVNYGGVHATEGATISVVGERAVILPGASVADGANVAIQGWPRLLANAQVQSLTNTDSSMRSALAISWNGQLLFVVSNSSMTLTEFARAIANELGATDAINMDGGGSSALVLSGIQYGAATNRKVASWLVVRSPFWSVVTILAMGIGVAGLVWGIKEHNAEHRRRRYK